MATFKQPVKVRGSEPRDWVTPMSEGYTHPEFTQVSAVNGAFPEFTQERVIRTNFRRRSTNFRERIATVANRTFSDIRGMSPSERMMESETMMSLAQKNVKLASTMETVRLYKTRKIKEIDAAHKLFNPTSKHWWTTAFFLFGDFVSIMAIVASFTVCPQFVVAAAIIGGSVNIGVGMLTFIQGTRALANGNTKKGWPLVICGVLFAAIGFVMLLPAFNVMYLINHPFYLSCLFLLSNIPLLIEVFGSRIIPMLRKRDYAHRLLKQLKSPEPLNGEIFNAEMIRKGVARRRLRLQKLVENLKRKLQTYNKQEICEAIRSLLDAVDREDFKKFGIGTELVEKLKELEKELNIETLKEALNKFSENIDKDLYYRSLSMKLEELSTEMGVSVATKAFKIFEEILIKEGIKTKTKTSLKLRITRWNRAQKARCVQQTSGIVSFNLGLVALFAAATILNPLTNIFLLGVMVIPIGLDLTWRYRNSSTEILAAKLKELDTIRDEIFEHDDGVALLARF